MTFTVAPRRVVLGWLLVSLLVAAFVAGVVVALLLTRDPAFVGKAVGRVGDSSYAR